MRKLLPLLVVTFLAVAATMERPAPEPITVEGKVVDSKCYGMATGMPEAAINDAHMVPNPNGDGMVEMANCGTACANMGIPVAVLEGGEAGGEEDTASSQQYEAVGVIVSFMAEKKFVNIAHKPIPGFMNAMTMPFDVKDTTLLRGFQEGDAITFHFTVADGIRAIEKRHVASSR